MHQQLYWSCMEQFTGHNREQGSANLPFTRPWEHFSGKALGVLLDDYCTARHMQEFSPQTHRTPLGFFYSKEHGISLRSDTCSCWLVLLSNLFTVFACRSSVVLCNLQDPFSFPKAVLNFEVYFLLHLGHCSPLLSQDCSGLTSSTEHLFCHQTYNSLLRLTCLPALFHYQHLKLEQSHQLSHRLTPASH